MDAARILEVLAEAEKNLPKWLENREAWDTWHSLDVDYEPPRVERVWRDLPDGFRLLLHRIHPCDKALFHPHPWPSAVKILSGRYEMGVGYLPEGDDGTKNPPVTVLTELAAGSSYVMVEPRGWHWVRPLGVPSLSVMITGPKWDRWSPKPAFKLNPLTREEHHRLCQDFRDFYTG